MQALRLLSEAVAFFLELAMLCAFGVWGFTLLQTPWVRWSAALGLPGVAIAIWSRWLAPRASHRLGRAGTAALSFILFELAAVALIRAGYLALGVAFAVVAAVSVGTTFTLRPR